MCTTWGRGQGRSLLAAVAALVVAMSGLSAAMATPAHAASAEAAVSTTPVRLWDSRPGSPRGLSGVAAQQLQANRMLEIPVAGLGPVPTDASAVLLNATATRAVRSGWLTLWPCGQALPGASTLNFERGKDRSNQATIKIGAGGKICAQSSQVTDLVLDVNGFLPAGSSFTVSEPQRVMDTRTTTKLRAGAELVVPVAGVAGVPANAAVVALNVTATAAEAAGYLTTYPCQTSAPEASSHNFSSWQDVANAVWAKVGANRAVCIRSSATVHVVVDLSGYQLSSTEGIVTVVPNRVMDSRSGWRVAGKVAGGSIAQLDVPGLGASESYSGPLLLNVTATQADGVGYLTVWPCDSQKPLASNLNFRPREDIPNAAFLRLGSTGKICLSPSVGTHLIVDFNGFVNPAGGTFTAPAPLPKPPPATPPAPRLVAGMTAAEIRMVDLINSARSVGRTCGGYGYQPPAPRVWAEQRLANAAQRHSDDMRVRDFFKHEGSDGSNAGIRMRDAGFTPSAWGENIAAGYRTPEEAMAGLLKSPGHCTTIMSPNFSYVGIGLSIGPSRYVYYWTQNFAR